MAIQSRFNIYYIKTVILSFCIKRTTVADKSIIIKEEVLSINSAQPVTYDKQYMVFVSPTLYDIGNKTPYIVFNIHTGKNNPLGKFHPMVFLEPPWGFGRVFHGVILNSFSPRNLYFWHNISQKLAKMFGFFFYFIEYFFLKTTV